MALSQTSPLPTDDAQRETTSTTMTTSLQAAARRRQCREAFVVHVGVESDPIDSDRARQSPLPTLRSLASPLSPTWSLSSARRLPSTQTGEMSSAQSRSPESESQSIIVKDKTTKTHCGETDLIVDATSFDSSPTVVAILCCNSKKKQKCQRRRGKKQKYARALVARAIRLAAH